MFGGFTMGEDRTDNVNDVLAALDRLQGRTDRIVCALRVEFEGDSIWSTPPSECRPDFPSSLWADFDLEAIGRSLAKLKEFDGRHLVVTANRDLRGHYLK